MRNLRNSMGPRSVVSLLAACGSLAAPAFAGAQDIPWSTDWASLPPATGANTVPRESTRSCPTLPGAGRAANVAMLAHGHPNEPDAVQVRLNVSNPQLLKALKLEPYVRVQTVCSASPDLTTDCETHSSEWKSITSNSDTWPEEECSESHPYLVGARCATSNGLPTPAVAAPDASTPDIDEPSGPEVSDTDSSDRDQSESNSCDLTTYPAATSAVMPADTSAKVYSSNGTVITNVVANGTGCPAGTWKSEISDDGTTFTTTFHAYKATVQRGDAIDVKDCQLSVQVKGAAGTSYALDSLTFNGVSKLSEGVTADLSTKYYVQGAPLAGVENKETLSGTSPAQFSHVTALAPDELVWSECNAPRDLEINTRVVLKNNEDASGTGTVNVDEAAGATLVVKLANRGC